MGLAGWAKSRGPPSSRQKGARDKVTKRRRGKERMEWGRDLGGLSLHFCPGAPKFQVTPLPAVIYKTNIRRFKQFH